MSYELAEPKIVYDMAEGCWRYKKDWKVSKEYPHVPINELWRALGDGTGTGDYIPLITIKQSDKERAGRVAELKEIMRKIETHLYQLQEFSDEVDEQFVLREVKHLRKELHLLREIIEKDEGEEIGRAHV